MNFKPRSAPLALLAACFLAYGLLIPWLGFYWDDWPAIWFLHFLGPAGFVQVFAGDRPLLGYLFRLTTTLFGESALVWQVFGFLTHWLAALTLWGLLRSLWPKAHRPALWAALLFSLYPGFSQQFISVTYSHVFLLQAAFLGSLWAMIHAFRQASSWRRLAWLALSMLLAGAVHFTVEYFFGLEVLRPLLLGLILTQTQGEQRLRWRDFALGSLPYLLLIAAFLGWRIFLSDTPRGEVELIPKLLAAPIPTIIDILQESSLDIWQTGFSTWFRLFDFRRLNDFGFWPAVTYWMVTGAALLLGAFYLFNFARKQMGEENTGSQRQAFWLLGLGAIGLLGSGWPFWATNLPVDLRFPWDRFTLAMMAPSSLLVTGLLTLIPGGHPRPHRMLRHLQTGMLTLLVALAVGYQYWNANLYRREWNQQSAFFWQLTWRAPAIQPGTILLASELPFIHFSDNSLTAPLNWIYQPEEFLTPMPYLLYALEARLGINLAKLEPGVAILENYRATEFQGSTNQALVLYYQPPGCLKVVDTRHDTRLPQKPKYISEAMPLSNPGLIAAQPAAPVSPPGHIFGREPAPDWCYYFEKAELARQSGDYTAIVGYAQSAFALQTASL